jgi:hypothetical protein
MLQNLPETRWQSFLRRDRDLRGGISTALAVLETAAIALGASSITRMWPMRAPWPMHGALSLRAGTSYRHRGPEHLAHVPALPEPVETQVMLGQHFGCNVPALSGKTHGAPSGAHGLGAASARFGASAASAPPPTTASRPPANALSAWRRVRVSARVRAKLSNSS